MKLHLMALAVGLGLSSISAVAMADNAKILKQSRAVDGFLDLNYHNESGEVYLEVTEDLLNKPMILMTSLPHGVGSNDIGLDRGQLGRTRLVQFEQQGPFLILKQLNTDYRANTDNAAEQRAVKEAFAESVLWRGKVLPGKTKLVPLNQLVINDLHGVTDTLARTKQGSYRLQPDLSLVLPEGVKSFDNNADVDVLLSFSADKAGPQVAQVTPDGKTISIRMRYSFVALPKPGYEPRAYHPNSGYLSDSYLDYATVVDQPVRQHHLLRHRLQKVNPGPAPSEVVEPIVYYLDPGVPEPVRSALLEGGRWWEDAFNETGFINGFKVELLPEDADPQDVRYNVIQWVHRATRGWSYGAAVTDPRTGEIIKGHVTLGSLRVRQDHLIARGLTAGWEDRDAAAQAAMSLSLDRIRQLSAHEIGHTLGLDHNFAASTNNDASVMDYPHPKATLKGEQIDISEPYGTGVGAWDKFTIAYGYGEFEKPEDMAALVEEVQNQGLRYIGESDSRAASAAHAYASLWDNGSDPVAELSRLAEVRRVAIDNFSDKALLDADPSGELADLFVPIYLLTRFQITAAAKLLGGVDYSFQQTSPGSWHYVAPEAQQAALDALLTQLKPAALTIPAQVQEQLVPKSGNYWRTRESFPSGLGAVVDSQAMAEVLSRHIVSTLLQSERLNRVSQAALLDREQMTVKQLLDKLVGQTLYEEPGNGVQQAVWKRTNAVIVDAMLTALYQDATAPEVKADLKAKLKDMLRQLQRKAKRSSDTLAAHYQYLADGISEGLDDSSKRLITKPLPMPPGSPI
ncbi:zinc-dependent metalloprotease [Shewanella submarina]|uniref:Zinc-dependent metalloprotease n=1 Tax=Shewanella submarina TaxID=2016376 RepID=A0ABV7G945_9GAMM|nr:zinc-dependent metalloprotease [Shewanella submarina]MCL1038478.1 zinc-dependent metalloprotease [Shewanella submarina]